MGITSRLAHEEPGIRIYLRRRNGVPFDTLVTDSGDMPLAVVVGGAVGKTRFVHGILPSSPIGRQVETALARLWAPKSPVEPHHPGPTRLLP